MTQFTEILKRVAESPELFGEILLEQLAALAERNKEFNAIIRTYVPYQPEVFSSIAKAIVAKKQGSPWCGLTFVVKDNFQIENAPLSFGMQPPLVEQTEGHAEIVHECIRQGATLLGSSQMDACAFGLFGDNPFYGRVTNPCYRERIAGGSSGGSAAAVAALFCHFALGSDHGGSLRIPAACCGVAAWKPSHSVLPREGVLLISTMDCPGMFAPNGPALKFLAEHFCGQHAGMKEIKNILLLSPEDRAGLDPEIEQSFESFIAAHDFQGTVMQLDVSLGFDQALQLRKKIIAKDFFDFCEGRKFYPPVDVPEAQAVLQLGRGISSAEYQELQEQSSELRSQVDKILGRDSLVLMPTIPRHPPAWKHIRRELTASKSRLSLNHYLVLANVCDLPAVSFPIKSSPGIWPLSIQALGPREGDFAVFQALGTGLWKSW
ncbi:MAG: amidase [Bdellovibrionales bacterium]|nr:amidase [Bdellovibrionales bacterium]